MNIIHDIGIYGHVLMFSLTIVSLWPVYVNIVVFFLGYLMNKELNQGLKLLFKEPRPEPMDMLQQQKYDIFGSYHRWLYGDNKIYIPHAHIYGMPSGHAQSAGYCLAFFYTIFSKIIQNSQRISSIFGIWIVLIVINVVTLYQRWAYKAHTIGQLALGNIVGIVFGGCVVYSTKYFLSYYHSKYPKI